MKIQQDASFPFFADLIYLCIQLLCFLFSIVMEEFSGKILFDKHEIENNVGGADVLEATLWLIIILMF